MKKEIIAENVIQKQIKKWCKDRSIYHRKITQRFSSGFPDTISIIDGRVYFIELKREGKNPTPLQASELAEIKQAGGNSHVARSLGDFIKIVRPI